MENLPFYVGILIIAIIKFIVQKEVRLIPQALVICLMSVALILFVWEFFDIFV